MSRKYEKLVFPLPAESNELVALGDDPGFIKSPQMYFRGATQIPGARFNMGFQIFVKPFFMDRIPHHHDVDEYLIFLGATFPNLFDFDADVQLSIGTPDEDAELFHITEPTVVRIPAGVEHCPLNFRRVAKPIFFQAALMQDMFSSTYRQEGGKTKELWYNGPIPCKLDKSKRCDCCRNCIEKDWR